MVATLEIASHLRAMEVTGFCVVDHVIPEDRCQSIRQSLMEAVIRERGKYPSPKNVAFVPTVINHDQSFAEYLADERLLQIVRGTLGNHPRISFTSAIVNEPGNDRGEWHADWPFNQRNAGHLPAPYPDVVFHLTTLWMLSPFRGQNGGTLIVPGSHRSPTNPTATNSGVDPQAAFPGETNASGSAGSVLVMDSRLWHATAPNRTQEPRVALAVRYAPWWLNTEVLRPGSDERKRMVDEVGAKENQVPSLKRSVFDQLPLNVQQLYRHWIE